MGRPARSAAGHSQSTVPSVGHLLCSGSMKVKRQAEHPRALLPRIHQRATLGLVEREVAEDRELVGVLAGGLDAELVRVRVPRRVRSEHRGIDAAGVHLLQRLVLQVGGDLPVPGAGGVARIPEVNLRVDDQHGQLLGHPRALSNARCRLRRVGRSCANRCTPAKIESAIEVRLGDHVRLEAAGEPLVVPVGGERILVGQRADVAQRPHAARAAA